MSAKQNPSSGSWLLMISLLIRYVAFTMWDSPVLDCGD